MISVLGTVDDGDHEDEVTTEHAQKGTFHSYCILPVMGPLFFFVVIVIVFSKIPLCLDAADDDPDDSDRGSDSGFMGLTFI